MIRQLKENKNTCCICGKEIKGYGNNAASVKSSICCDECNIKVVIPARLGIREEVKESIKEGL